MPQKRKAEQDDSEPEAVETDQESAESGDDNILEKIPIPAKPKVPKGKECVIQEFMLEFLSNLAQNNHREWFQLHKNIYDVAKQVFVAVADKAIEATRRIDDQIPPHMIAKNCLFRINRDVRFSANKSPYKTHLSAAWSKDGKKGKFAFYYLHLQPHGESLLAAGIWCPSASTLAEIRQGIDQDAQILRTSLERAELKAILDGKSALDRLLSTEHKLKTRPKGFPKDHPNLDLLKLKSFTIGKKFSDAEVLSDSFNDRLARTIEAFQPFVHALNSYLTDDGA
ncbi:hypothetical protein HDV03_001509 [Kappamyces sp. JEL0829]|nr:hypothetical protein HDV03_001509 [Kappamyces sp. JEL0829]